MDPATFTPVAKLLVVIWGLELVLLNAAERAANAARGATLGACILALAVFAISLIAPPDGVLVLAGVVGLHGLTIAFLFAANRQDSRRHRIAIETLPAAQKTDPSSLRQDATMRSL
jgi:hypothetical protein